MTDSPGWPAHEARPADDRRAIVRGTTDSRFRAVSDAFAGGFDRFPELGASLCIVVDGKVVVDVYGGHSDAARRRPWQPDTVVNVFSATKGAVAVAAHRLAEQGRLDLDAPVAAYWPGFAAADKAAIPVRWLLDHSAGLPAVHRPLPSGMLYNWEAITDALAADEPWWEPGTAHGYHAVTFGFLVGEVLRRITGRTIRRIIGDEVAGPLGLDLSVGVADPADPRIAEVPPTIVPPAARDNPVARSATEPTSITALAFANPPDLVEPGVVNTARWRRAEIPASNGHSNARALARLYGVLAAGGSRYLSASTISSAVSERRRGIDLVLGAESVFATGFMLPSALRPFGRHGSSFGHPGAGGALGFADMDASLGFGYVPNQTIASMQGGDPRWRPLIDAVYACLG